VQLAVLDRDQAVESGAGELLAFFHFTRQHLVFAVKDIDIACRGKLARAEGGEEAVLDPFAQGLDRGGFTETGVGRST
jgi:hypothetical protein